MAGRLQGKVAIVTGTSPNIGGGIAEAFAAEGAAVVCVDHEETNALDCARALSAAGARAMGVQCDVRDEPQVQDVVARTLAAYGHVDTLVNGAAYYNHKGLLEMTVEEFRDQTDLILSGAFLFTKYVARAMIEGRKTGCVIHLASTEAHQGNPKNVAYCTAKAGLLNMARANAMELAAHGIRVNTLTPTATHPGEGAERAARWGRPKPDITNHLAIRRGKLLPAGEPPSPSDYGHAAVYLASDDARFVTGFDLRVDAGAIARYWGWGQDTL